MNRTFLTIMTRKSSSICPTGVAGGTAAIGAAEVTKVAADVTAGVAAAGVAAAGTAARVAACFHDRGSSLIYHLLQRLIASF